MDNIEKEIKIADIVARKLIADTEVTEDEENLLQKWLEESEIHREWFDRYKNEFSLKEFDEVVGMSNEKEQWVRLDQLTKGERRINWKSWMAYAAGVILLLSAGFWFGRQREHADILPVNQMATIKPASNQATLILNSGERILLKGLDTLVNTELSNINIHTGVIEYDIKETQHTTEEYNTIEVPRGGIYSLVLSDGTKVFLNSDTRLKYPVKFSGACRNVELSGEAFFEVTSDSLHPFVVQAGGMETRVLGTSFNVSAYTDESFVQTTLFTGKVEVSVNNGVIKKNMKPGMQANWIVGDDNIAVKAVNLAMQSRWRDGIIILDDDELEEVMRMLSRWYDVTYEFKEEHRMKHTFTGKIDRNEDLESVLQALTLLGGPRFEIVGKRVYIY